MKKISNKIKIIILSIQILKKMTIKKHIELCTPDLCEQKPPISRLILT